MKNSVFKIILIAVFAISYSSAKEYSINFLIEIASEKAIAYNKASSEHDRLYYEYGRNCSDRDDYCWKRAMDQANTVSNLRSIQDDAIYFFRTKLINAYEKKPIELTEKQRYLIESTILKYIGFDNTNSALYKALK